MSGFLHFSSDGKWWWKSATFPRRASSVRVCEYVLCVERVLGVVLCSVNTYAVVLLIDVLSFFCGCGGEIEIHPTALVSVSVWDLLLISVCKLSCDRLCVFMAVLCLDVCECFPRSDGVYLCRLVDVKWLRSFSKRHVEFLSMLLFFSSVVPSALCF